MSAKTVTIALCLILLISTATASNIFKASNSESTLVWDEEKFVFRSGDWVLDIALKVGIGDLNKTVGQFTSSSIGSSSQGFTKKVGGGWKYYLDLANIQTAQKDALQHFKFEFVKDTKGLVSAKDFNKESLSISAGGFVFDFSDLRDSGFDVWTEGTSVIVRKSGGWAKDISLDPTIIPTGTGTYVSIKWVEDVNMIIAFSSNVNGITVKQ